MDTRFQLSDQLAQKLEALHDQTGYSPEQILARSVALYDLGINKASPEGQREMTVKIGDAYTQVKL